MTKPAKFSCSFCAKLQNEVKLLIEKPGMFICNECVIQFQNDLKRPGAWQVTEQHKECSFCFFMQNLPELQQPNEPLGRKLISGSKFSICDECLDVCAEIVIESET